MPLSAYLYTQKIIAPLLNDNEWRHIVKSLRENPEYLHFKCCDSPVYARISSQGLRHFVHKNTGHCNYVSESDDHLQMKLEVFKACRELGWNAELEYIGENFRSDVLADKDKHKIAFEIQLSRQDLPTTVNRQETLRKAGIRCAWFFKRIPKDYKVNEFLPVFEIEKDDNNNQGIFHCNFRGKKIAIKEFIGLLLESSLKFRNRLTIKKKQKAMVFSFDEECWRCGFQFKTIGIWAVLESNCGLKIDSNLFNLEKLTIDTGILLNAIKKHYPNVKSIKKGNNKANIGIEVINVCPQCKAVVNCDMISSKVLQSVSEETKPENEIEYFIVSYDNGNSFDCSHWCLKSSEGFCDL
ncbi:MAG: hypothetical protein J7K40_05355 [candidate division Zixibacteria bacterium]|nr:hypothetical protein [candidate division Zixibacteria bacterium]